MSPEERLQRAHDLSIAALLADTIYNFGELVSVNSASIKNHESPTLNPTAHAPNTGFAERK